MAIGFAIGDAAVVVAVGVVLSVVTGTIASQVAALESMGLLLTFDKELLMVFLFVTVPVTFGLFPPPLRVLELVLAAVKEFGLFFVVIGRRAFFWFT